MSFIPNQTDEAQVVFDIRDFEMVSLLGEFSLRITEISRIFKLPFHIQSVHL